MSTVIVRKARSLWKILVKKESLYRKKVSLTRGIFKPVMLSQYGKRIRNVIPTVRPWCRYFPRMLVILSDGEVTTCCYDPRGNNRLGSVYERDISELWNHRIRAFLLSGDLYDLTQCRECIGTMRAPVLSNKGERLEWQRFAYRYPKVIQVEIMARCNYGCCDSNEMYRYRRNGATKPDLDVIFENIRSFLPNVEQLNLFNVGEPLLHDGLCAFIRKCRAVSDTLSLRLCTNGSLLDEKVSECLVREKVDTVCVSIHGGPGTDNMLKYSKYGADYETVMANIKRLTGMRARYDSGLPSVEVKTILFSWNDSDELMNRLGQDAKVAGADTVRWDLDCDFGGFGRSSKRFFLKRQSGWTHR